MAECMKLGDDLINLVRRESELQSRLVGGQITSMLAGKPQARRLTDEEKDVWLDSFTATMAQLGPEEEAFFARRCQLGLGVGLDAVGNLVRAEAKREA